MFPGQRRWFVRYASFHVWSRRDKALERWNELLLPRTRTGYVQDCGSARRVQCWTRFYGRRRRALVWHGIRHCSRKDSANCHVPGPWNSRCQNRGRHGWSCHFGILCVHGSFGSNTRRHNSKQRYQHIPRSASVCRSHYDPDFGH